MHHEKGRPASLQAHLDRLFKLSGGHMIGDARQFYFQPMDLAEAAATHAGKPFVSFANYDYLGLARHPEVIQAGIDALHRFGSGALASRIVGGERSVHRSLEQALARFAGAEDAISLVSGYLTNETLIGMLMGGRDLVLYDEWSHASILAGLKTTRARSLQFRHNDLDHLRELLTANRNEHPNCLIVVEGLYSMEGDAPDLAAILALKEEFGAWLMIDEAHSFGVLGETGRGVCEHAGVDPSRVELTIGTLSKSFVSCGGFITGKKAILDMLRLGMPGFIFSVGLPPVVAATAQAAVEIAEREPWRTNRLAAKTARMIGRAKEAGLSTGAAMGHGIVPVMFASQQEAVAAAACLFEQGVYAPPIIQAGVPSNKPRLRFFISAAHDDRDIDRAVDALAGFVRGPQVELA